MGMWIGVGGVWKQFQTVGPSIGVGSAWKNISKMWIGVGGAWKECFASFAVKLSDMALGDTQTGTPATCSVAINSDGSITVGGNNSSSPPADEWGFPNAAGVGNDYWVRMTTTSGAAFDVGALGTWQHLDVSRGWSFTVNAGIDGGTALLEIATDSGGSNVIESCNVSYSCQVF